MSGERGWKALVAEAPEKALQRWLGGLARCQISVVCVVLAQGGRAFLGEKRGRRGGSGELLVGVRAVFSVFSVAAVGGQLAVWQLDVRDVKTSPTLMQSLSSPTIAQRQVAL